MPAKRSFFQANQLLAQLVPHDVLREARKLAERIEHEERFKTYLLRRFWIIFPAALLFIAVNTACARAVILFLAPRLTSQSELAIAAGWLFAAAFWIGGFLLELYLLFAWLERRAGREGVFSDNRVADPAEKPHSFPWVLFALFVVFPLSILLSSVPQEVMLAIIAVGLFLPIIYTLFDK